MRETEEFGGLLYMDNTLDTTPAPTILSTSRFFPLALLTLPVITLVLVFVAPIASAGASLAGSELAWAALVAGGVAAAYSIGHRLRQCRHSSLIHERTTPTRLTQLVAHTLVVCTSLGVLVVLAVESGASWALMVVRTMNSAQAVAVTLSGLHQLYVAPRYVESNNLMMAYDAVMTTEQESVALEAGVWEECAKARACVSLEKLQAERIHHLEAQKMELAAEVVRLHNYFAAPESETSCDTTPDTRLMIQIDQHTSDLRTLNASHKTLSDQLKQTAAEKDQSDQVIANFENELNEERAHVVKMRNNMIQLKELLQSTVLSRDEIKQKYKLLKRSMSKIVGVQPPTDRSIKVEQTKTEPQIAAHWIQPSIHA